MATNSPKHILFVTRIIWAGLLAGQIAFMLFVTWQLDEQKPIANDSELLGYICFGTFFPVAAVAFFIRNQCYKRGWQDNIVTPQAYLQGNLIFLAMLEGLSFFSLVITMRQGSLDIAFVPALLAMSLQVINFPHGKPMFAT